MKGSTTFLPQIPYGARDFLPHEAKRKRLMEDRLGRLFQQWGYDEVITPTFEYVETLAASSESNFFEKNVFQFFDQNNRLLALRPDMTTPMARVASTRLKESQGPLRLFYLTNVFRQEEYQAGRQCEFYQAGVELMGSQSAAADAEVIALAIEAMASAGLKEFQISIGQIAFTNGIMAALELKPEDEQAVKACLIHRDLVKLEYVIDKLNLTGEARNLLKQIPLLHGDKQMLDKLCAQVTNPMSQGALKNLQEIYTLLETYGVAQYVCFDLGVFRDFDYYTGMVFEGYTPGLGFPVMGGGRYDQMMGSFGQDCAATGFALGLERVLLALERQDLLPELPLKDVYIAWAEGALNKALMKAKELRQQGKTVEVALASQNRSEAEGVPSSRGYAELVYIEA